MNLPSTISVALVLATLFCGQLGAQVSSRAQVQIEFPTLKIQPDGSEVLDTQKLTVEVPSAVLKDFRDHAGKLQLTEEQAKELNRRVRRAVLDYIRNAHRVNASGASDEEINAKLMEIDERFSNQSETIVEEVLSPSQRDQLKQARRKDAARTLSYLSLDDPLLMDELGLDQVEFERLQALLRASQRRLNEETTQFRERRYKELLREVLSDDQLEKLEAILKGIDDSP